MITIYGSIMSPYVRKVLMFLELKGIDYKIQYIYPSEETHKQLLLEMNPLGKIPVYQDGDITISDSSVICAYIEKKYSEISLYPNNAESYAKALWYEEYADSELIQTIRIIFRNSAQVAPKLNLISDMRVVNKALAEQLPSIFSYLNKELINKKFLVDDKLSIADISIFSGFLNLELLGYSIDIKKWDGLATYISKLSENNSIKKILLEGKENFKERFASNKI